VRLYRGTIRRERTRGMYGFSWTTHRDIAEKFADRHSEAAKRLAASKLSIAPNDYGIVLETVAPSWAILLVREEEGYYDEGEVVVDPYGLSTITISPWPA
jgi:hypothetical protein